MGGGWVHTCPPEEEGGSLTFFFFFSQVLNLPGCRCTLFLGLWFVCLSASQRKHGVVDMAEPVVKPGGYRQFSCQTVDGADKTALSRC